MGKCIWFVYDIKVNVLINSVIIFLVNVKCSECFFIISEVLIDINFNEGIIWIGL